MAEVASQIDLKLIKIQKNKKGTYGIKPLGKEGKGKDRLQPVQPMSHDELDQLSFLFDQDLFESKYNIIYDPVFKKINSISRGWTEDTIGSMPVLFDRDLFQLSDITEIVVQGNKVVASLAGQTEFEKPIQSACIKNKLNASFKGDLMTIKMPPITTSDYQKKIKMAQATVKSFKTKTAALIESEIVEIHENMKNLEENQFHLFEPSLNGLRDLLASYRLHLTLYDIEKIKEIESILKLKHTLLLGK